MIKKTLGAREEILTRLLSIMILAITILAYYRVLDCDFLILDDRAFIITNSWVNQGLTVEGVRWAFDPLGAYMWKPITWMSHMLDVSLFGMNPAGHHAVNLILHTGNALLLFLFLRKATGALWESFIAAVIFAVHPINVESVAWLAERKNVLSMFWGILALFAYYEYISDRRWYMYVAVLISLALGLMSKPMLVTWPFVMVLLDIWPLNRLPLETEARFERGKGTRRALSCLKTLFMLVLEKTPMLLLVGAVSVVTYIVQKQAGAVMENLNAGLKLAVVLTSYLAYLGDIFFPHDLTPFYLLYRNIPIWPAVLSGVLLTGLTAFALLVYRRAPYVLVGWLWYLGTLVPVIGIVQVGRQIRADRYMYVPMIGLLMAVVWGIGALWRRYEPNRILAWAIGLPLLAALTFSTWTQVGYWKNQITLFQHTISIYPNNYMGHFHLGTGYMEYGNDALAIKHYLIAHRYHTGYFYPISRLGFILFRSGKVDEARKYYEEYLRLKPGDPKINHDLGVALAHQGHWAAAIRQFIKSLEINPADSHARRNLHRSIDKWRKEGFRGLEPAAKGGGDAPRGD